MHDPKFEQEVQQKMAELEFSPSESVWANIEKAVNKRKERRFLPFFLRFALPSLLLLAGGGYLLLRGDHAPATATTTGTVTTATTPAAAKTSATKPAGSTATATTTVTPKKPGSTATPDGAAVTIPAATTSVIKASPAAPTARSIAEPAKEAPAIPATSNGRNRLATTNTHNRKKEHKYKPGIALNTPGEPALNTTDKPALKTPAEPALFDPATTSIDDPATASIAAQTRQNQRQHISADYSPALASLDKNKTAVFGKELKTKTTSTITPRKPKQPWEAAFVGGAGISALHQMQIDNYSIASDLPASNFAANTSITQNVVTPSKQYVSKVDPGFSFWAGVQARKQLSQRWAFTAGLNLHYYSTRVKLGYQITSYNAAVSPYFQSNFAPIQNYPYYSSGDLTTYTNKYYFLELPVGVEYQINRSHLLPIFVNGGVNVSYLMGSSAVYFSKKDGVYYKDGGVANHTQFNLAGGLMVGLPVRGLRMQVGPQIQYGLTPLLNTSRSGEQHIFYTGLKLVIYPGRSK